jgi:DNA-binding CsgD family transcriptional regulator
LVGDSGTWGAITLLREAGSANFDPADADLLASLAGLEWSPAAINDHSIARALVRAPSGRWLLVRGSTIDDRSATRAAVILEPARSSELAPLIADAYALTDRERRVTQLVAQGRSTQEIADELYLSPYTVQDHFKSIFEKVDVSSRGELVARLFFEHYAPRLMSETPVGSDGWFAPSPDR